MEALEIQRQKVATAVEKMKADISKKKIAKATKRTKITTFIARQKSRKEFVPLMSNLIDKAQVGPLHLKNKACALVHRHLLHIRQHLHYPTFLILYLLFHRFFQILYYLNMLKYKQITMFSLKAGKENNSGLMIPGLMARILTTGTDLQDQ